MPMDYTIAAPQFNVAPAQVGGPVNMLTDVLKLKGLQQEQQLNQLKFQEYQRARGEAALKSAEEKANKQALISAMRSASVGATGPQLPDMEAAANSLIGQGKLAPALTALGANEAFTKNLKAKSDLAKVDTENLDKQLSTFRTFAAQVRSPEDAGVYAQAMYDHPVIGPLMRQTGYDKTAAAAKAAQDFTTDPQRWMASQVGLTGQQVVDTLKQTTANTDLGGQILQQQRDAFGRPIEGGETRLAKTLTPEQTAKRAAEEDPIKVQETFDKTLDNLVDQYRKLGEKGMLIKPGETSIGNRAAAVASVAAPELTTILSPDRASGVAAIANMRQTALTALMGATGMSAKQIDSNAEMKAYLNSLSNPGQPVEAIVDTLNNLSQRFGRGKIVTVEDITGGKTQNPSTDNGVPTGPRGRRGTLTPPPVAAAPAAANAPAAAAPNQPVKPTLNQFLARVKPLNPNASTEDLTAYYNRTYGGR